MAGGPEPRAGAREGWFGTTGEGERVDPGGALRVAVAVLGAVDLVWWLCVRLLYLCGRRDGEEPGRPGARYLGIGWQRAVVNGGALCEAWIGFVPVDAEPRDGWPVGWEWQACPLEPPRWSFNPDVDDRASQEPGSIGILVRDGGGRARLACWVTAWGDRWTAPGFDLGRLVRLLRAEITDAELRAEECDETEDYPDDEDDPDAPEPAATSPQPAWMQDAPPLPAGLVWGWDGVWMKVFDPSGDEVASAVHDGHAWLWKVGGRWAGAKNRRAAMLKIAEALATQEAEQRNAAAAVVAAERPPATCRTGSEPVDPRVADLPPLPAGYRWRALTDTAAGAEWDDGLRRTVFDAELRPSTEDQGAAWSWFVVGCARLGPSARGVEGNRISAANRIARELYRRVDEAKALELERQAEGGQS